MIYERKPQVIPELKRTPQIYLVEERKKNILIT
jgi:hypothetical protein